MWVEDVCLVGVDAEEAGVEDAVGGGRGEEVAALGGGVAVVGGGGVVVCWCAEAGGGDGGEEVGWCAEEGPEFGGGCGVAGEAAGCADYGDGFGGWWIGHCELPRLSVWVDRMIDVLMVGLVDDW